MNTAIYPGSFDPITNGHLDIIERAARLYDRVLVVVFRNIGKTPTFTLDERLEMIHEATRHLPQVEAAASDTLTAEFAREHGANVIIKGIRSISDFESEMKMAQMNKRLEPNVETLFMMTAAQYSFLSSSIVKEVASYGGSVEGLVPPGALGRLQDKYPGLKRQPPSAGDSRRGVGKE